MALVLADSPPDRLQPLAKCTGRLSLAFTCIDLDSVTHVERDQAIVIEPRATMSPHLGVKICHAHEGRWSGASGHDDFHPFRTVVQSFDHVLLIQQSEIQHRIQLIKHHN